MGFFVNDYLFRCLQSSEMPLRSLAFLMCQRIIPFAFRSISGGGGGKHWWNYCTFSWFTYIVQESCLQCLVKWWSPSSSAESCLMRACKEFSSGYTELMWWLKILLRCFLGCILQPFIPLPIRNVPLFICIVLCATSMVLTSTVICFAAGRCLTQWLSEACVLLLRPSSSYCCWARAPADPHQWGEKLCIGTLIWIVILVPCTCSFPLAQLRPIELWPQFLFFQLPALGWFQKRTVCGNVSVFFPSFLLQMPSYFCNSS